MKFNKIFVACPISKYIMGDRIEPSFEIFIKEIYEICKLHAKEVFLALDREDYGKNKMYGADCTVADFNEIKEADLLIAFPEDSMGVSVELGWASMLEKSILVFIDKRYKQSELVKSINSITKGKSIIIDTSDGYLHQKEYIKNQIVSYIS